MKYTYTTDKALKASGVVWILFQDGIDTAWHKTRKGARLAAVRDALKTAIADAQEQGFTKPYDLMIAIEIRFRLVTIDGGPALNYMGSEYDALIIEDRS